MSKQSRKEHHFYMGSLMNGTAIVFGITCRKPRARIETYLWEHGMDYACFDQEIYEQWIPSRTNRTVLRHEGRFRRALQDMGYGIHPRGSGEPTEIARIAMVDAIPISRALWPQSCMESWNARLRQDFLETADNVIRIAG